MENSFKYRFIAFTLVGVFAVFNIGLPVVLHYCEMMKSTTTSTCGMCDTESPKDNQVQYNSFKSACCKTIFTPERNKNEFLQTQKNGVTKLQISIIPSDIGGLHSSMSIDFQNISKTFLIDTHSPPLSEDIPIFTSSLLI
jgi:hypothetical protein